MDELIPTRFDNLGTNNLPLNCGWLLGKINVRGRKHIHKIGECFYESFINRRGKKFWTFRCKAYRDGCTWKMKMIPVNKDDNSPDFWNTENWIIVSQERENHTCEPTPPQEVTSNQFLVFLRQKLDEGITDLKTIRTLIGIDDKYAQQASVYLKDSAAYRVTISDYKKKKYGDIDDQVPMDLRVIKTYDSTQNTMIEEQFYFEIAGIEFFGIPSLFKVKKI